VPVTPGDTEESYEERETIRVMKEYQEYRKRPDFYLESSSLEKSAVEKKPSPKAKVKTRFPEKDSNIRVTRKGVLALGNEIKAEKIYK
jgi:hypothetical protein